MAKSAPPARRSKKPVATSAGHAEPVSLEDLPTLDPADIAHDDARALIARGAAYVREYAKVEHEPTILLRSLAVVLVELRKRHTDGDGRRDMLGRSYPYRQDAGEIYRQAGISEATRARTQQAVRWHIGNILRDVLDPAEVESYDLQPKSPLERMQDDRASRAALVTVSRAEVTAQSSDGAPTVKATADHLRMATAALNITNQLSVEVIDEAMTDGQRAKLDEQLAAMQETIRKLRRHTRKSRSEA